MNYGPPTSLFHPALARLKHSLEHLEELTPDSAILGQCSNFITGVCEVYPDESGREESLRAGLRDLIGRPELCKEHSPFSPKSSTKSGGKVAPKLR